MLRTAQAQLYPVPLAAWSAEGARFRPVRQLQLFAEPKAPSYPESWRKVPKIGKSERECLLWPHWLFGMLWGPEVPLRQAIAQPLAARQELPLVEYRLLNEC
jgi:hypothetical protein